jgi:predicted Rossmann-fold nucleotide-binding protein
MKVCVYCASSSKIDPAFFRATEELAGLLVQYNMDVVYGGGAYGLMGKLADVVPAHGGNIKGIMPTV